MGILGGASYHGNPSYMAVGVNNAEEITPKRLIGACAGCHRLFLIRLIISSIRKEAGLGGALAPRPPRLHSLVGPAQGQAPLGELWHER